MSDKSSSSSSAGMGCGGFLAAALTVLFVYLKITGQIAWSWVWVLSPIWIYVGLSVFLLLAVLAIAALIGGGAIGFGYFKKRRELKQREERDRLRRASQARPLGTFNSVGERVEPRKPHSWMF
jgi:hypothetical protein